MSAEPRGTHQQGKPLPADTIARLKRAYKDADHKLKEACRRAGVTKMTGRKYLRPQQPLPDLDI